MYCLHMCVYMYVCIYVYIYIYSLGWVARNVGHAVGALELRVHRRGAVGVVRVDLVMCI